jgi:aminoacylase
MKLGDVTTLNLTVLKAGVTADGKTYNYNVIPTEAEAGRHNFLGKFSLI